LTLHTFFDSTPDTPTGNNISTLPFDTFLTEAEEGPKWVARFHTECTASVQVVRTKNYQFKNNLYQGTHLGVSEDGMIETRAKKLRTLRYVSNVSLTGLALAGYCSQHSHEKDG
jgi:hypothetical protein